jgi:amidohydrolase
MDAGIDEWLNARAGDLIAIRRHLHAHPELSHHEFETAALVMRELKAAGLEPTLLPGGNGVVCDIGTGDRVVAFRADLDALPMDDTKDVPYRSEMDGVAHACGHDVHTTVLLGLGLALAGSGLPGRVRLIFQPAEESPPDFGSLEMIAAGALAGVAELFAVHCYPRLPAGTVGVRAGAFTAAADIVEVTLRGPGGHTSRPHLTTDLVYAMAQVVVGVPGLLTRRVDPRDVVSLVWGAANSGEAPNAIPGTARLRGTVRTLDREAWKGLPDLVTGLIHDVAATAGAGAEVNYIRGVPPVVNDPTATATITSAAVAALGADRVVEAEISMGGEDFAFYLEHVPGAMIRLGTGMPGEEAHRDLHRGDFDVDERCIAAGVRVLARTALDAISAPGSPGSPGSPGRRGRAERPSR